MASIPAPSAANLLTRAKRLPPGPANQLRAWVRAQDAGPLPSWTEPEHEPLRAAAYSEMLALEAKAAHDEAATSHPRWAAFTPARQVIATAIARDCGFDTFPIDTAFAAPHDAETSDMVLDVIEAYADPLDRIEDHIATEGGDVVPHAEEMAARIVDRAAEERGDYGVAIQWVADNGTDAPVSSNGRFSGDPIELIVQIDAVLAQMRALRDELTRLAEATNETKENN